MLLVDDAQENIQVVNSILKDIYKIRIATNGPKALELAKADPPPALVLLDVMMPEMDGYECASLPAVTWHRGSSGPFVGDIEKRFDGCRTQSLAGSRVTQVRQASKLRA